MFVSGIMPSEETFVTDIIHLTFANPFVIMINNQNMYNLPDIHSVVSVTA